MKKFMKSLIGAWFGIALSSCSSALYVPDKAHVPEGMSLTELTEGRAVYVAHCGSCHSLHLPGEFSVDIWKQNLDEMQKKSKISNEEKALILNYLLSEPKKP